jgi:hypothetical protein
VPLDVLVRKFDRGNPSAKPGHRCDSAVKLDCGLKRGQIQQPVTWEGADQADNWQRHSPTVKRYENTTRGGDFRRLSPTPARASARVGPHGAMLLVAALLPLPRVGPRGGLAQLSAAEYAVRRCDMADPADAAAYRAVSKSRDTLARPGVVQDAPERTVSVRWSTSASVTVLIAVGSWQASTDAAGGRAIAGSLEMIGPLEASGALPRRCLLRDLWVAEAHRRRGLARRLVLAAEESVASQG